MSATDNAIEALAANASGTVLALDDIALADGRDITKIIYTLSSGSGKKRMNQAAILKPSYSWSTFIIISGEKSLEEKIKGDGGVWQAGMAVRIADIDVTNVNDKVARETMDTVGLAFENFGHAGPLFIEALIKQEFHKKSEELRERINKSAKNIALRQESQRVRAALPFAIMQIAGDLAKEFGILPSETPVRAAVLWAWEQFINSSEAFSLNISEQIIENIRHWIAER